MACLICGEAKGNNYCAREMMFGFKDEFVYFECSKCGCLQLQNPPEEMARYYPPFYYSFAKLAPPIILPRKGIRKWLYEKRNEAQLFPTNWIWRLLARFRPNYALKPLPEWLLKGAKRGLKTSILEVGCGQGKLLRRLAENGFQKLIGVDPFISTSMGYGDNLQIKRAFFEEIKGDQFDLIFFDHSLEHMPNQIQTLIHVQGLLSNNGICVIRIPLASSAAWRKYGVDWVDLDAPRHLFLHTSKSLSIAASRAKLTVESTEYDGVSHTYWGSELYRRGISLFSSTETASPGPNPDEHFSPIEMKKFEEQAARDNANGQGGWGIFFLRHKTKSEKTQNN